MAADDKDKQKQKASASGPTDWNKMEIKFKNPEFQHSFKASSSKRAWKNLKQICNAEQQALAKSKTSGGEGGSCYYWSIDAPPSFSPAKKYSDLSGLPAKYTDPQTKLRYATAEEFKAIRKMPGDVVASYLALRKANTPLQ